MSINTCIRTERLVKSFRRRRVVNGISIELNQGEVVGLLGQNGAGKTTTFYMVTGLLQPDSGKVWLGSRNISRLPMYRRARIGIGYLPQEPSVFRKLTVEQNLLLVLEAQRMSHKERGRRIGSLLDDFNLLHLRRQRTEVLSGGERRRVEIARALATSPNFILLDEPFTGVDPIEVNSIQEMVLDLKMMNIGVLITDHNVRETLAITDRSYIVKDGQVIASGGSEEITADPMARKYYLGHDFQL
ncbi:MAG TPA: LPS export ABC transporter ATP-binding protein [Armatimonadota bacterium]|nr:LPS export ABC transporter ATP-binding protein [Armatimonadota bacterium]